MNILFFPFLWFSRSKLQKRLAGKTVLITGASYGIGECLAESLAETKAHLLLVARTEEKLIEVKQRVEARGGRADVFPCDLTNVAEVETLLEKLQQLPDGIDIFVNNAGKSIRRSIFDSLDRLHDFTRTMNLNYVGPVQLMLSSHSIISCTTGACDQCLSSKCAPGTSTKMGCLSSIENGIRSVVSQCRTELNARGVSTTSIYLPLVRTRMIEPTRAYRNMPAMRPEQVAQLICKAINSRSALMPLVAPLGQLASVLCRWPWEVILSRRLQRKR